MSTYAESDEAARACYQKKRYQPDTANRVIARAFEERGVRLRTYACLHCGGLHLTKTGVATNAS